MADYTLTIITERPYEETVAAVREQLAEAGSGVLTEIDLKSTPSRPSSTSTWRPR